ncbi:unnamed protein product [Arctogadus glacialis]
MASEFKESDIYLFYGADPRAWSWVQTSFVYIREEDPPRPPGRHREHTVSTRSGPRYTWPGYGLRPQRKEDRGLGFRTWVRVSGSLRRLSMGDLLEDQRRNGIIFVSRNG